MDNGKLLPIIMAIAGTVKTLPAIIRELRRPGVTPGREAELLESLDNLEVKLSELHRQLEEGCGP